MGDGGTHPADHGGDVIARLRKRDVEALLDGYDADPIGALTLALQVILERPHTDWAALVAAAPLPPSRRAALLAREQPALDALVRELNELRTLG